MNLYEKRGRNGKGQIMFAGPNGTGSEYIQMNGSGVSQNGMINHQQRGNTQIVGTESM
jgi:hypothetical protein